MLRLSNIVPDKPVIHMYHHQFCNPLARGDTGNHFAYLKPISAPQPTPPPTTQLTQPTINTAPTDTNVPVHSIIQNVCSTINQKVEKRDNGNHLKPISAPQPTSSTPSTSSPPHPTQPTAQNIQPDNTAPILPVVPNLCSTINRNEALDECLTHLSRTNTTGSNHKACVCVICDCFIIGVEKICWLSEEKLKAKQSYLSVDFVTAYTQKQIPTELRDQYKIINNKALCNLLLPPRAHVKGGSYMSCKSCHKHISYSKSENPPKFAISNGWLIGEIPKSLIGHDISDILASSLARVRVFGNVYSYSAGAHN